ncbi:Phosphatidylinositol-4-phosphate 5-kinase and related FYVE finger-containing proteins [Plasmopara halstedii]|uniref:Phosphatidylinositol-4-phosphate 5-kinase and related FYVE finger-containing proteins n=1 Tax=Plasmopara halstedii TaxID=4781 RepID=A0A0P1ALH7_PLAHL|nr:Phosphatidylinositol-4-phosphate 5-kinase and related FYVE finger-containing proteins [Plasmopara halstedii]CEG41966.1 Phosphatidylinositol-4-phosphate 5-kinase and related FYVE finger-containing proteins [Plasmopara halstedii]|eukprot:XP_024578335.1 Phosphatidylinositol-4-phosphate 5-kinase and related FYVE finger-containing proteins [Plasmopara halstedii]
MRIEKRVKEQTNLSRGSIAIGEGYNDEPSGLTASVDGQERLVFSRQQICDDLLNSLPKLHAALRSKPSKSEHWKRIPSNSTRVNTFESVGIPCDDGGADGTQVIYAVTAMTYLQCHINEVLNVLVSQKTSDYEATMRALSSKSFEGGEILYHEKCQLLPIDRDTSKGSPALLGVQMAAYRPSWQLRMASNHLRHPEHPRSQRLCFASLTHRYPEANRAVHVMKTLPKSVHDQIIPKEYRSALRDPVDHLGIAYDIAYESRQDRIQQTRIFLHAYVGIPIQDHNSSTSSRLWDHRNSSSFTLESKHVIELLTNQLKEFEHVIARRRYGLQSFIYFQPSQSMDTSFVQHFNICHVCLKRFSLFRRELYCQICGHFVCGECSQLYQVEARIGKVRQNRLCLYCVKRVNSCTFSLEDLSAALGPTVVPSTTFLDNHEVNKNAATSLGTTLFYDTDLISQDSKKRLSGFAQLRQVLRKLTTNRLKTTQNVPLTKESVQTQLRHYVDQSLQNFKHKFDASSLKVADLVRDYRFVFDTSQTTYEDLPLPPTPSSANEARRLHHIQTAGVFEPEYDHSALNLLAEEAAKRLKCPIGFVSFVDDILCYSNGTYQLRTPRSESMCSHTIYVDKPLVIKNAESDVRFAQLLVVRDGGIRFYVGFPIRAPDGVIIATLCTWDRKPHYNISTADYAVMHTLSKVAAHLITPRNQVVRLPYQPRTHSAANCRMNSRTRRHQGNHEQSSLFKD